MERTRKGFENVQRKHVEQACRDLLREGPPRGGGAYFIRFDGHDLPAKLILREAYRLANQREIASSEFNGGLYTARILKALDFEVVVRARPRDERAPNAES